MKQLVLALSVLFLWSCNSGSKSDTYTINGTATGMADGTNILVYQINPTTNQPAVIDTVTVQGGSFSAAYAKTDIRVVNYFAIEGKGTVAYFPENIDLDAVIYKDSIQTSYVAGSPQNDSYRKFTKKMASFVDQKKANAQRARTAQQEGDNEMIRQIKQEDRDLVELEKVYKTKFIAENGNSIFL